MITAAAIGAIAGAVIVLARRQITDFISIAIALTTVLFLLRFKKLQEPFVILVAALLGLIIKLWF
jgi:chromate transporter